MHEDDSAAGGFEAVLHAAVRRCGAPLCVGLDPVPDRLPAAVADTSGTEAIEAFCRGVVEAVAPHAAAIKPQSACFERFGSRGVAVLERCVAHAHDAGLAVLLDAKRGDIDVSARHYAEAASSLGAHAITVQPYLGMAAIVPYLDAGLSVFVLVRTSNPDSAAIQAAPLRDGGTVAGHVAELVAELGHTRGGVHAVVGATQAQEAETLRGRMPEQIFLLPGVGAQGGSIADALRFAAPGPDPRLLPTASRSIIYPDTAPGEAWTDAVARAAAGMNESLAAAISARASNST
ncbi:MAG: orotidine-5'-phosphate decarboxylase [Planctomycetota bacterium]